MPKGVPCSTNTVTMRMAFVIKEKIPPDIQERILHSRHKFAIK